MQIRNTLFAALAGSVAGHIHMVEPAPITAKENPNSGGNTDYNINAPLASMAQYPCKGVIEKYFDGPEGTSVATYAPGSKNAIKIGTGAVHNGGSCQISLSYDKGATFKVLKSIIGNCPTQEGSFPFTIPSDAPEGKAVLSWSWNNEVGNREFYQNCAAVTIGSGGGQKRDAEVAPRASFSSLPDIFVGNLEGAKYCVAEGTDVMYPNPGPDVDNTSSKAGPPTECGGGGDPGSNVGISSSAAPAPSSSSSAAPAPSSSSTPTSSSASSTNGGIFFPSDSATPTPSATSSPTTLQTSTVSSSAEAPSSPPAEPTPTSIAPPAAPTGGAGQLSGPCQTEGDWNCVDGASFQRCASGQWSSAIPMAPGTTCSVGVSDTLSMHRRSGSGPIRRRGLASDF